MGDNPFVVPFRPPIALVDFAKCHPQAPVVRVIVGFVRNRRIHRIRSGHLVPIGSVDRPEHWLGTRAKKIAGYQFSIPHDVDPIGLLDGRKLPKANGPDDDPNGNEQQNG
jgi:hypothetical protein